MTTRTVKIITGTQAYELLQEPQFQHQFFGAEFIKKDGTRRTVNGRRKVVKHLKGGELSYAPSEYGYIIYWDRVSGDYRTLNTNTLVKLRIGKQDYLVIGKDVSRDENISITIDKGVTFERG